MRFDPAKEIYFSLVPKEKSIFRKNGGDSNYMVDGECTLHFQRDPAANVTKDFAFENREAPAGLGCVDSLKC